MNNSNRTFQKRVTSRGFTLPEVIVVVGINTVLLLAIIYTIVWIYQTNSYYLAQTNEVDVARKGIAEWSRDAREMTFAADGSFPMLVLGENEMAFFSNIDQDDAIEYVRYELSSTTLYRYIHKPTGNPPVYNFSVPDSTHTISEYIQNIDQGIPLFVYYGNSGMPLVSPMAMITDARYIGMQMIVNVDPVRSPGEFELRGSVAPRNVKDNI